MEKKQRPASVRRTSKNETSQSATSGSQRLSTIVNMSTSEAERPMVNTSAGMVTEVNSKLVRLQSAVALDVSDQTSQEPLIKNTEVSQIVDSEEAISQQRRFKSSSRPRPEIVTKPSQIAVSINRRRLSKTPQRPEDRQPTHKPQDRTNQNFFHTRDRSDLTDQKTINLPQKPQRSHEPADCAKPPLAGYKTPPKNNKTPQKRLHPTLTWASFQTPDEYCMKCQRVHLRNFHWTEFDGDEWEYLRGAWEENQKKGKKVFLASQEEQLEPVLGSRKKSTDGQSLVSGRGQDSTEALFGIASIKSAQISKREISQVQPATTRQKSLESQKVMFKPEDSIPANFDDPDYNFELQSSLIGMDDIRYSVKKNQFDPTQNLSMIFSERQVIEFPSENHTMIAGGEFTPKASAMKAQTPSTWSKISKPQLLTSTGPKYPPTVILPPADAKPPQKNISLKEVSVLDETVLSHGSGFGIPEPEIKYTQNNKNIVTSVEGRFLEQNTSEQAQKPPENQQPNLKPQTHSGSSSLPRRPVFTITRDSVDRASLEVLCEGIKISPSVAPKIEMSDSVQIGANSPVERENEVKKGAKGLKTPDRAVSESAHAARGTFGKGNFMGQSNIKGIAVVQPNKAGTWGASRTVTLPGQIEHQTHERYRSPKDQTAQSKMERTQSGKYHPLQKSQELKKRSSVNEKFVDQKRTPGRLRLTKQSQRP